MTKRHQLVLAQRPGTEFDAACVSLSESNQPEVVDGTFLVRVDYVTMDLAMLGWMRAGRSYMPNIRIGDAIHATAVGRVIASRHVGYREGDHVAGLFGAQSHALSKGHGVVKLNTGHASPGQWAGSLGLTTAITGYVGLALADMTLDGRTVLVSGASGLVGSSVAQLARNRGARVVGIAGGQEKCKTCIEILRIEECVDYTSAAFEQDLRAACPDRVDVFFDNVGGELLDLCLAWMATFGKVVLCGTSGARGVAEPYRLSNIREAIMERLQIQGYVVFDHDALYDQAATEIGTAFSLQDLVLLHQDMVYKGGLEDFAAAYQDLASGRQRGKHVLKL